ncbi:MAG: hypothetical protein KGL74_04120 [Elusimicrobia bacterium]|nr:hypothetical protein [Elusimicrobiota bacterium]
MRKILSLAALALVAGGVLSGCGMLGITKDEASIDFDRETRADDIKVREDKTRSDLGRIEAAIADYYKTNAAIPKRLDLLVPKFLAEVPPLDVPECGKETTEVEYYPPDVLRGGQVDGTRLRGSGRWGYVFNGRRVVIFVDCLKRSDAGVPWYQVRGVY